MQVNKTQKIAALIFRFRVTIFLCYFSWIYGFYYCYVISVPSSKPFFLVDPSFTFFPYYN